ncbi:MAG TPA: DUF309 domain-containing protein [Thermoanaerobaculia bacterium]|nr:DUF309 domain-containing protein [Thermoanaerobaculia bacterium]
MQTTEIERGVHLFNAHEFWHAHEAWEEVWLRSHGEEKQFLQGLIQLAAAYHHIKRDTPRGAGRLFDAALRRMSGTPDNFFGIDRREAVEAATRHREILARGGRVEIEEAPKLHLILA